MIHHGPREPLRAGEPRPRGAAASGRRPAAGGRTPTPLRRPGRAWRARPGRRSRPSIGPTPLHLQIRDIGSGNFGVAKLCRAKDTGELVAVKFIERGEKASGRQARGWPGRLCRPPAGARRSCWRLLPPRARAAAASRRAPAGATGPCRLTRMWSGRSSTTACCRGTPTSCGSGRCVASTAADASLSRVCLLCCTHHVCCGVAGALCCCVLGVRIIAAASMSPARLPLARTLPTQCLPIFPPAAQVFLTSTHLGM